MTSRRPMTRSFSANGRTSSFNEEDTSSSNGRTERSGSYLSNVRPENSYSRYSRYRPTRSTLCSVMAQLTEDVQPSFETTLKSKAVSENCNVKFTCVVSGTPPPELKWYKDDAEMDRYCGLPKYEIRKNGKTHTLHIYKCTLDDAAIYQVSASNSKGIVSCSGVLEVGTMNEFKIHQRFFEKLKQKAEKKKRDLLEVQTKKENKENTPSSPERPPRKRHIPPLKDNLVVKKPDDMEHLGAAAEINGVPMETTPVTSAESVREKHVPPSTEPLAKKKMKISNGIDVDVSSSSKSHMMGNGGENSYDGGKSLAQFLAEALQAQAAEEKENSHPLEKRLSVIKDSPQSEKRLSVIKDSPQQEKCLSVIKDSPQQEKRLSVIKDSPQQEKRLSVIKDSPQQEKRLSVIKDSPQQEKRLSVIKDSPQPEKRFNVNKDSPQPKKRLHVNKDSPQLDKRLNDSKETVRVEREGKASEEDHGKEIRRKESSATESENERESSVEASNPTVSSKHHSKSHKDHEHHNIQTSISSVFHSVKDFFFGKGKKDSLGHKDNKERGTDHDSGQPCPSETPPSFNLQPQPTPEMDKPLIEDIAPMETNDLNMPSDSVDIAQQAMSSEVHKHKSEDSFPPTELPPVHKQPSEQAEESTMGPRVEEALDPVEAMDVSTGAESSSPSQDTSLSELQLVTEMTHKDKEAPVKPPEPDTRHESPLRTDVRALSLTAAPYEDEHLPLSTITSMEKKQIPLPAILISVSDSNADLRQAPTAETQHQELQLRVDKKSDGGKSAAEEALRSSREEEKDEVKLSERPSTDINTCTITELAKTSSLKERIEPPDSKTQDQVLSPPPTVAECTADKDGPTEEVQEMNIGLSPTAKSLEKVDLKTQHECKEESAQVQNQSAEQSSSSGFDGKKEITDVKEEVKSATQKSVDVFDSGKPEEAMVLEVDKKEGKAEELQIEMETESKAEAIEMSDDSKILSISQNEKSNPEEPGGSTHKDEGERRLGWPTENIPQIQISIVDDSSPSTPDVNECIIERFIIPKIEIMEPELKDCPVLESIIPKLEPAVLHEPEESLSSEVVLTERSVTDSPGSPPTERGMQNDGNISPTGKVRELNHEVKMPVKQEHVKSSQLPQMEFASLPIINVSVVDDSNSEFANGHVPRGEPRTLEAPAMSLFVVPPISITCHESDAHPELPTQSEWTETETVTQRGTKPDVGDNNVRTKLKKRNQKIEEVPQKGTEKEITETPKVITQKAPDNPAVPALNTTTVENVVPEIMKMKPTKEPKSEPSVSVEDLQRTRRSSVDRLSSKPPAHPSLSPASLRRFMSKTPTDGDNEAPSGDKADEDLSGGSTPTSLSCENSPRMKRRDSLTLIRSATPEELASGARRKIFIPKTKEDGEEPYMSPSQARRAALLQAAKGQKTPPMERRSPLLNRRKAMLEVPKVEDIPKEELISKKEEKPAEKKPDPLKAPQVIRKIRGEPFPDASGHLKLWCQFFNVLSDSTIKWFRDEEEILEVKRSGGDESQVALAIVLASSQDCGVYGCTIKNEHGTDTTDFLLSEDVLADILLRDDLEVGEEIEMTPLLFPKGLVDTGNWGDKYFGRIMTETANIGEGHAHKTSRARVIYGLDPIFDSGTKCVFKVQNPIPYGTKQESNLAERNLEITKQECKVQDMIREYCKIFAAEARVNENFGFSLEVIPRYLMHRPANSVPYATVEADLEGVYLKYCTIDPKGKLITQTASELEQKCNTFQHWIHQWTHGNLLVTRLEGVEARLTNISVVTKSKGYQGLTEVGSPEVFEQFQTLHQCNYYCGLLGLRPLKSLETPKIKGSRSPLLGRRLSTSGLQKGVSPQMTRKVNSSPKVPRKAQESEDDKSNTKVKSVETADVVEVR